MKTVAPRPELTPPTDSDQMSVSDDVGNQHYFKSSATRRGIDSSRLFRHARTYPQTAPDHLYLFNQGNIYSTTNSLHIQNIDQNNNLKGGPDFSRALTAVEEYNNYSRHPNTMYHSNGFSSPNKLVVTFPPKKKSRIHSRAHTVPLNTIQDVPFPSASQRFSPKNSYSYNSNKNTNNSPSPPPPIRTNTSSIYRNNSPVFSSLGVIKPLYPLSVRTRTSWVKRYQYKVNTTSHLHQARISAFLQ